MCTNSVLTAHHVQQCHIVLHHACTHTHPQVRIPSCVVYHYDVAIVPDKCPRRVNREIVEALVQAHADYFGHQKPVFDGRKNLYSRRPLPIGRDRVSGVWEGGREGGRWLTLWIDLWIGLWKWVILVMAFWHGCFRVSHLTMQRVLEWYLQRACFLNSWVPRICDLSTLV